MLMGVMLGFLIITLVMMDLAAVFVAKRAGQNAADAAALGVSHAMQALLRDSVSEAVQQKLDILWETVQGEVDVALAEWESERRAELRAEIEAEMAAAEEGGADTEPGTETGEEAGSVALPESDPAEVEAAIAAAIAERIAEERPVVREDLVASAVRRQVRNAEVAQAILKGTPINQAVLVAELLEPPELGCVVKQTILDNERALAEVADDYATANGAAGVVTLDVLSKNQSRVHVRIRHRLRLVAMSRLVPDSHRYLQVDAASNFTVVPDMEPDYGAACP